MIETIALPEARATVRALSVSRIREIANAGMDRQDVLAFWFGESDQPTPEFIRDAAAGNLPAYSFIEPRYFADPISGRMPNDQHPPHNVAFGEALIAAVYNAVRENNWPLRELTRVKATLEEAFVELTQD